MRPVLVILALGIVLAGPALGQRLSFEGTDADHDGRLSRDEYVASRDRQFRNFDKNGDGVISSTDFARTASYRRTLRDIDRMLAIYDIDGDGRVTSEEVHTGGTPLFDHADADRDGFLTSGELTALHDAISKRRRSIS